MITWLQHVDKWKDCKNCALGEQRSNICLARGILPCDVLYVGEAPGVNEDIFAQPFVGPAGDLLTQIDERAIPADVARAFTNLVACFPRLAKQTGNHQPERGEVLECRPRLIEFVNIARPRLIVRAGRLAQDYCGFDGSVPFVDIDHPAYILRMPLVQRQMASQRCVVQIRSAWEKVAEQPVTEWEQWGKDYDAKGEKKRRQLQQIYDEAAARGERHPDDPIPF